MMENATYNKIKLLNHVSEMIWFIEKHALKDAEGDIDCVELLKQLHADLEKQLAALQKSLKCCSEFK